MGHGLIPREELLKKALGVNRNASVKVAMLRLGPVNTIELVEYTSPDQRKKMPKVSDWGSSHLALYVDDIEVATKNLKDRGIKVLCGGQIPTGQDQSKELSMFIF